MARRTLEQRARDALRKLGVKDAESLTSGELFGIAQSLKLVKVAEDVARVRSCIANGALPSRCANTHGSMIDKTGGVLAKLDVFNLRDGSTQISGIGVGTGTVTRMVVDGRVIPLVLFNECRKLSDEIDHPAIAMNTKGMMPGSRLTVSIGAQP